MVEPAVRIGGSARSRGCHRWGVCVDLELQWQRDRVDAVRGSALPWRIAVRAKRLDARAGRIGCTLNRDLDCDRTAVPRVVARGSGGHGVADLKSDGTCGWHNEEPESEGE